MKNYFLLLFFSCTPFLFAQETDTLSKEIVVSPFNNLKVYSGIEVKLIPEAEDKLVIYGDNLDDVVATLKGKTLKIRMTLESILKDFGYIYVEVYHTQPLDMIDMSQGSFFQSDTSFEQTSLLVKVQEGSRFEATMNVLRLDAKVSSGSKLFLEGTCQNFNLSVNTGGSCEAEKMHTDQSMVRVVGGGYGYVHAKELVNANVKLGGTIRIYGEPEKKITKKTLGGKIFFMD